MQKLVAPSETCACARAFPLESFSCIHRDGLMARRPPPCAGLYVVHGDLSSGDLFYPWPVVTSSSQRSFISHSAAAEGRFCFAARGGGGLVAAHHSVADTDRAPIEGRRDDEDMLHGACMPTGGHALMHARSFLNGRVETLLPERHELQSQMVLSHESTPGAPAGYALEQSWCRPRHQLSRRGYGVRSPASWAV
jgi:hypothetical protein